MITGYVTSEREPLVQLTVLGPNGESLETEALVDTGSDGYLTLPPDQIEKLQLPWLQSGEVVLADGTESIFDIYGGVVVWGDTSRRILIDVMEAAPLIGMSLFAEHEVNMEVTTGGKVTIRPIRPRRHITAGGPRGAWPCYHEPMVELEDIYEPEWVDWFRLTPEERWNESAKLWQHYLAVGGSLDPEPDPQSPFYDPETASRPSADGRPGMRVVRRSGV